MAQMFPAVQASDAIPVTLGADFNLNTTTSGKYKYGALYVGTTGNVVVQMADDNASSPTYITFTAVPAGTLLPIAVKVIRSTENGTTASNIVALVSKTGIR